MEVLPCVKFNPYADNQVRHVSVSSNQIQRAHCLPLLCYEVDKKIRKKKWHKMMMLAVTFIEFVASKGAIQNDHKEKRDLLRTVTRPDKGIYCQQLSKSLTAKLEHPIDVPGFGLT